MSAALEPDRRVAAESGQYFKRYGRSGLLAIAVVALLAIAYAMWRPELPIATTFRPAFGGNSEVAQFHNTSDRYLVIQATFENSTLQQRRVAVLNVGPYRMVEFGWLEGWAFMSGEHIVLVSKAYRSKRVGVP